MRGLVALRCRAGPRVSAPPAPRTAVYLIILLELPVTSRDLVFAQSGMCALFPVSKYSRCRAARTRVPQRRQRNLKAVRAEDGEEGAAVPPTVS